MSISELIAHADLPAFDIVVVVIDIDAAAAVFYVGIPVRRNVVADTDFISIDVIADTDGRKALPAGCQGNLALEADLIAVGLGRRSRRQRPTDTA